MVIALVILVDLGGKAMERYGLIVVFLFSLTLLGFSESPVIVELLAKDVEDRSLIAQYIHIDSVESDRVYSVVNQFDLGRLKENPDINILSVEILTEDRVSDYYRPFLAIADFPEYDDDFHTYDEMVDELKKLEQESMLIELFSLGQSVGKKELWAIKMSAPSFLKEEKKAIAYFGTHHAREHVSTEIPLLLAKDLVSRYELDPLVRSLLDEVDIYIIPMVNPDGAMFDITDRRYKWWRKNRRANKDNSFGVDLNRNYGNGWGSGGSSSSPRSDIYMGEAPFSEPETQSIKRFFENNPNITIALSFHTFSELILYPWGKKKSGVGGEDEQIYKKMASDMAEMNGYRPMQSSKLYIASGDTCDWLYGDLHVFCFTFELSPSSLSLGGFYPGEEIIQRVFNDNLGPMLYLAEFAKDPKLVLIKDNAEPREP